MPDALISNSTSRTTFRSKPVTIIGAPLRPGDFMPDATLLTPEWAQVSLSKFSGQVRLFSVIPSLATGICDTQTRRLNDEARRLGARVRVITISADLPFTQKRWQTDADAHAMTMLSDTMSLAFGDAIGAHVAEMRVLQRCILVVSDTDKVTYAEYVPEIAQHPDYDAALAALTALLG